MILRDELSYLAYEGYTTAEEAWPAIQTGEPCLILLDLNLPGRSGLELLGMLANEGIRCPVVVLTASSSALDAVACHSTCIAASIPMLYLTKTGTASDITAAIANFARATAQ